MKFCENYNDYTRILGKTFRTTLINATMRSKSVLFASVTAEDRTYTFSLCRKFSKNFRVYAPREIIIIPARRAREDSERNHRAPLTKLLSL